MCSCCQEALLTVIGNNTLTTPTAAPVVLTVDRPLTDMPADGCFDLRIPKALLKNINPNPVQLSDGTTALDMVTRCTDPLRYDSLVACSAENPLRACLLLRCNRRTQPAPGHVLCKTCLPPSSYAAPAAPAPTGGAGA